VPRRLALILLVALAAWPPPERAAAATPHGVLRCAAHGKPRATLLLLPGGGFVMPAEPVALRARCRLFARAGFAVVAVAYPLLGCPAALRAATDEALRARRAARPVLAYGESAGGTLAEMLAVRGAVPAAVAVAGISDLTTWPRTDERYWSAVQLPTLLERQAVSPLHRIGPRPGRLLLLHSPEDETVPFAQSVRPAGRHPGCCHPSATTWMTYPPHQSSPNTSPTVSCAGLPMTVQSPGSRSAGLPA